MPFITTIVVQRILNVLVANFQEANLRFERKLRGKFMGFLISKRWVMRMRKFGPDMHEIHRQKIRHRFTMGALVSQDNAKQKALKMVKLIMEKEMMLCTFLYYF